MVAAHASATEDDTAPALPSSRKKDAPPPCTPAQWLGQVQGLTYLLLPTTRAPFLSSNGLFRSRPWVGRTTNERSIRRPIRRPMNARGAGAATRCFRSSDGPATIVNEDIDLKGGGNVMIFPFPFLLLVIWALLLHQTTCTVIR